MSGLKLYVWRSADLDGPVNPWFAEVAAIGASSGPAYTVPSDEILAADRFATHAEAVAGGLALLAELSR